MTSTLTTAVWIKRILTRSKRGSYYLVLDLVGFFCLSAVSILIMYQSSMCQHDNENALAVLWSPRLSVQYSPSRRDRVKMSDPPTHSNTVFCNKQYRKFSVRQTINAKIIKKLPYIKCIKILLKVFRNWDKPSLDFVFMKKYENYQQNWVEGWRV